jgi:hypothetical protein
VCSFTATQPTSVTRNSAETRPSARAGMPHDARSRWVSSTRRPFGTVWYFSTAGVIDGFNKSLDDRETEPWDISWYYQRVADRRE